MKHDIYKFIFKSLLAALPAFAFIIFYMVQDPFRVVQNYDPYFPAHVKPSPGWNRGYACVDVLEKHGKERGYDSFIFGNSRSIYYPADEWKRYIGDTAKVFHFDGSGEVIEAIRLKLHYLKDNNYKVRHALFVIDADVLRGKPSESAIGCIPPQVTGKISDYYLFQRRFFQLFSRRKFFEAYVDYLHHGYDEYMSDEHMFTPDVWDYDSISNSEVYNHYEQLIASGDTAYYNAKRMKCFYERAKTEQEDVPCISDTCAIILRDIAQMLKDGGTDYRIVISPKYNQLRMTNGDMAKLKSIFGADKVFDFSGKNDLTEDYHGYYESSHYRPKVAREVLRRVYTDKNKQ